MRPTVFYRGDSKELAFFVEDARKAGCKFRLKRVPMPHTILRQFVLNLDPGKPGQKVFERNNIFGRRLLKRHRTLDAEVSRSHPSERVQMGATPQLLSQIVSQTPHVRPTRTHHTKSGERRRETRDLEGGYLNRNSNGFQSHPPTCQLVGGYPSHLLGRDDWRLLVKCTC